MKCDLPSGWERRGVVVTRDPAATDCSVAGDPCIVWDDRASAWRMVMFYSPSGHAQAVCRSREDVGPDQWEFLGPIPLTNPQDVLGGYMHKPFIVMDADHPNQAASIDGRYWLLGISLRDGHKVVQRARAEQLAGPWTLEQAPLIDTGEEGAFDAKHVDAVTACFFPARQEVLYFYMGYPSAPQPRRISPYGSAQAAAVQGVGEPRVRKLGPILPPCQQEGHWASGWVGGLQLLPGKRHRWLGIANASPTPPLPADEAMHREEPPPSLGGFACCDEEWPVRGWRWCPEPIEWIEDVPSQAVEAGEGVNLWRQHILCLPDGRMALFYNSGPYGREQLYLKMSLRARGSRPAAVRSRPLSPPFLRRKGPSRSMGA